MLILTPPNVLFFWDFWIWTAILNRKEKGKIIYLKQHKWKWGISGFLSSLEVVLEQLYQSWSYFNHMALPFSTGYAVKLCAVKPEDVKCNGRAYIF